MDNSIREIESTLLSQQGKTGTWFDPAAAHAPLATRPWARRAARATAGLLLIHSIFLSTVAYGQIVAYKAAPSGQRPIMDSAQNGVPIMHIAPPSAGGVSRNQYDQFNVDANGAILNNSAVPVQTQQGGWISGNMQLGPVPARIILNEVMGPNVSQLRGTIEVAGRSADIVIANPNGITCNGCGFLNTGRASLVTGQPQFNGDGSIRAFDVRQGQLTVGGNGLNASNLEQLDLIARGIVLEGEVWAKNLNVIAGANQVLYGTLQSLVQPGVGTAPQFAVDIKDLGGMYANQVYLLSTEKGLGVNSTGRTAALQGNLFLSVDGDLSLKDSYAKQGIQIAGGGNVRLSGQTSSEGPISISVARALENVGVLDSRGRLELAAADIGNSGLLAQQSADAAILNASGSIANTGSIYSAGSLSLNAGRIADAGGSIQSSGNMELQAAQIALSGTRVVSDGAVHFAATGSLSTGGADIRAGTDLHASIGSALDNSSGAWQAGRDLMLQAASIGNRSGSLIAGRQMQLSAAGYVDNGGGNLLAIGDVSLAAQSLSNEKGRIASDANTVVRMSGALGNQSGSISGKSGVSIDTGALDNSAGMLVSDAALKINTGAFVSDGGIVASAGRQDGVLEIEAASLSNRQGEINAAGALRITSAGAFDNTGGNVLAGTDAGAADGRAGIQAAVLDNSGGRIVSRGDSSLATGELRNDKAGAARGAIASAAGAVTISAAKTSNAGGVITAAGNTSLSAAALDNAGGEVSSGMRLSVDTNGQVLSNIGGALLSAGSIEVRAGAIANQADAGGQAGRISAAGDIALQAASLDNDGGSIAGGRNVDLILAGPLSNRNGAIEGAGALSATAEDIDGRSGRFAANGTLSLQGRSITVSDATIAAGDTIAITSATSLDNTRGKIASNRSVQVAATSLNNASGIISAADIAEIHLGSGLLNNSGGRLVGNQDLILQSGEIRNAGGTIATGAALAIDTQGQAFDNSGGQVVSNGDLRIDSDKLTNSGGTIASIDGRLDIDTQGQVLRNDGGKLQARGDVTLKSGATDSRNGLVSGSNITVTIAALANDGGLVIADGTLAVSSQGLTNDKGLLQATGAIIIDTHGQALVNTSSGNSGGIAAGATLDIAAGSIDNKAGYIASNGSQTINVSGDIDNRAAGGQSGQILGNADGTIAASGLQNNGGRISVLGNAMFTVGTLDNRAGQIAAGGSAVLSLGMLNNAIQNAQGGTIDANDIIATAASIDNSGGAIRAGADATLTAAALNNAAGTLSAKKNISMAATSFSNGGGQVVGDRSVTLTTSSRSFGGSIASANDVTLNVNGDYSNDTLLSAQRNLTVNAANIANSGVLKAGQTLTANTGNLSNSGEINGQTVLLNASGTLTNTASGLIEGSDVRINAASTDNAGRIYGDWLRISGGTLNNSGSGTIAARDTLLVGVQNLNNTDGGLIYSLGDIGIGGSINGAGQLQGAAQNVVNASSRIEAVRNLGIASTTILNRNDRLLTTMVVEPVTRQDLIQPANSASRYPISLCSGIGGGQDDNSCIVHPDRYGQRWPVTPVWTPVCSYDGIFDVCTDKINYAWDSPAFTQFAVTSVASPPIEPSGGCSAIGPDLIVFPITSPQCNQWRNDYAIWEESYQTALVQLSIKISAYNTVVNEDNRLDIFEDYTWFRINVTKSHTELLSSDPGKILAGGSISMSGSVTNRDSQIVAGGALSVSGPTVNNIATKGEQRTDYSGTMQSTHVDHCGPFEHCRNWDPVNPYNPAPEIVSVDLPTVRYEAYAGNQTDTRNLTVATAVADSRAAAGVITASGNSRSLAGQAVQAVLTSASGVQPTPHAPPLVVRMTVGASDKRAGDVVLSAAMPLSIPQNSLFIVHTQPQARYLVETDPRFTNQRAFLSSDYFHQALLRDPERQLKRYGDGFVEQQLINDQILALTGRRYLSGYSNTEDEYKALMDAGVAFTQQYQLTPGVALTAEQMALLTTDVVLLTTRIVTLADGSTQEVLVPQVYLRRPAGQDLQPDGALMAGTDVQIRTQGDLVNSGAIQGDSVTVQAERDLINQGGRISGQDILLRANNDLKNLSGVIAGTGNVGLLAGRDIVLQTQTLASSNTDGSSMRTSLQRIATVQGKDLQLMAGRDLIAAGAAVQADGDLIATAARDLRIGTAISQYQLHVDDTSGRTVQGRSAYLDEAATRNLSSRINAGGSAILAAGGDARISGSTVSAQDVLVQAQNVKIEVATDRVAADLQAVGTKQYNRVARDDEALVVSQLNAANNVTVRATGNGSVGSGNLEIVGSAIVADQGQVVLAANNDLTISAGTTRHAAIDESYSKSSSLFSSVQTTRSNSRTLVQAEGSIISGNTVIAQAGHNLAVHGSAVAGDGDVTLVAGNALTIAAATSTSTQKQFSKVEEQGFLSGGGFGISYGRRVTTNTLDTDGTTQSGQERSLVGSRQGDLNLVAGGKVHVSGSDLVAGRNMTLVGQSVTIDPGQDTSQSRAVMKMEQDAFTLSVGGNVVNAMQTIEQMGEAAGKTKNKRVQALAVATAALAANNAARDIAANGVNVSISLTYGHSETEQIQTHAETVHSGSRLQAGRDLVIAATGAGRDSNIDILGSDVAAGRDLTLVADNRITLQAAQDTESQHSTSKSLSAAAGVAATIGTGGMSFGMTASVSAGRAQEDGEGVTQVNTHVAAGNVLSIQSGGDTTLKGAVASGKQVMADIGGNLTIESLQDTAKFDSKSQNIGGSITAGFGGVAGSVSSSKSTVKSDYASVVEQSGIKASDGGFQVAVKGHTDLKGAVIASSGKAIQENKNSLMTATLATSDIQNKAEVKADSSGISLSTDMFTQGKYGVAKGVIGNLLNSGSESGSSSGVTKSAISAGAVMITGDAKEQAMTGKTAEEIIATLNRDTANAHTAATKQDIQVMQDAAEASRVIKQGVFNEAVKFSDESYRKMFIDKAVIYELVKDKDGKQVVDDRGMPVARALSDEEKYSLKVASDGKVHITNNGIFNDVNAAAKYANQHSTPDGPQYLIHFPEADNIVSELMIAGYQKYLESNAMGLTNATQETKWMMLQYGQSGLQLDGHSRGAMTIGNGLEASQNETDAKGMLSGTTINFFGPAYNAQKADEILSVLQNRNSADPAKQGSMVLQLQNHVADPVGGIIGGNPGTGGTIPDGSSIFKEMIRVPDGEFTVHNCYGNGDPRCKQFWGNSVTGQPVLKPINTLHGLQTGN